MVRRPEAAVWARAFCSLGQTGGSSFHLSSMPSLLSILALAPKPIPSDITFQLEARSGKVGTVPGLTSQNPQKTQLAFLLLVGVL